ncbi:hypothetical protein BP6252_05802 [Coleophoma cylindrospora]|uniref:Alpha/beta hydrolase fold-3 domain-containing protein n=1 Tax=Coleophoma cylindrospora TaxID=1849047 RepID=A0A3D8RUK4_9HELO|nr:hypothetical protein BP6252_05802 [Coleophoma cylindrospora]
MTGATATEGFAEPWLAFEKDMGGRFTLHGPLEKIFEQYVGFGTTLMAKSTFPTPDESVKTEDKVISDDLKVRVYTPPDYAGDKPVCLFLHGGGWAMGDLDAEDIHMRLVSKAAGIVIVSIDYRLAPMHKFPAQLDDGMAAYHWALSNASTLKTTPKKCLTFGTSAGANLALALALRIIDEGFEDTLEGVVAVMPVTVHPDAVPAKYKSRYTSYDEHDQHTINSKSAMRAFADAYGADPADPYNSPLLHEKLAKLKRVYMAAAEMDTLRDDARLFKFSLDEAG